VLEAEVREFEDAREMEVEDKTSPAVELEPPPVADARFAIGTAHDLADKLN
jgi:hypothetical protein